MGAHILVVDDDPLLAAALRRPLAYEGFEIEVAASGEEALTRALDHPPDLVILDVLLPGIDGLEVCRRLRYAGNVGTGFTHAFLADLQRQLAPLEVPTPMFEGFEGTPRPRGARFVRPELVCEVEYLKWTQDDKLRAASFKGLRPDKPPTDARREHPVDTPS